MRKIFLVLGLAVLTASCVSPGPNLDGCEQLGKSKSVTIEYGDGTFTIKPKINVKQKSVFVIKLKPKSNDDKKKIVKIVGDSVSPGGAGVEPPSWLDTSDSYNKRKKFVYCTPGLPGEVAQEYKYTVDVGAGQILVDPRIHVTY